jgi:hypothetical protein
MSTVLYRFSVLLLLLLCVPDGHEVLGVVLFFGGLIAAFGE